MDMDAITLGTTDYEDLMRDSGDNMSSEPRGLPGSLARLAGGDGAGVQLSAYNYTSLESMVSEAWERRPGLNMQLHEACVLLLSALVVGLHGLHGLLQAALSARATAALLNVGMALAGLAALAWLWALAYSALWRLFLGGDDEEDEKAEAVEEADAPGAGAGALEAEPLELESIVSAQLAKEERVQRWIDNLCAARDQVNLEACGEMEGRNMEAEVSSADLLGDGQPARPAPTAPVSPRVPRPLATPPPSTPPKAVLPAPAQVTTMSRETQRALSLAYELSLAVRQTTGDIRATLSAPEGSIQGATFASLSTLAEHKDAWKVVRRGKEALNIPTAKRSIKPSDADLDADTPRPQQQQPHSRKPSGQAAPEPPPPPPPPRTESSPETSAPPQAEAESESRAAAAATPLNPSSSLLSFVRRFSGSRFLRELTSTMADCSVQGQPAPGLGLPALPALRLKDTRSLSLQLESRQVGELALPPAPAPAQASAPAPAPQRSSLALPRVELDRAPGLAPLRSNVMKVFSKGILSEGAVDFSTTSIQDTARSLSHGAAAHESTPPGATAGAGAGASLDAAVGLQRSSRTTTAATSTTEGRSTMNLSAHRDLVELLRQDVTPVTTSRGLTANMSEEGIPRPVVDDEHKSLFDLRKSLLTSIPEAAAEAAAPDEQDAPSQYL